MLDNLLPENKTNLLHLFNLPRQKCTTVCVCATTHSELFNLPESWMNTNLPLFSFLHHCKTRVHNRTLLAGSASDMCLFWKNTKKSIWTLIVLTQKCGPKALFKSCLNRWLNGENRNEIDILSFSRIIHCVTWWRHRWETRQYYIYQGQIVSTVSN